MAGETLLSLTKSVRAVALTLELLAVGKVEGVGIGEGAGSPR
jgi:hypothetical protein